MELFIAYAIVLAFALALNRGASIVNKSWDDANKQAKEVTSNLRGPIE